MTQQDKTTKIYCNRCTGETRHRLLATSPYSNTVTSDWRELGEYRLWVCAGCDTAVLEDCWDDELNSQKDEPKYVSIYHPRRTTSDMTHKLFIRLPVKLEQVYTEVVRALNEDLLLLCAIGLRSLVEGICADKGIAAWSLEDKIEGLQKHLPRNIVDNLHGFRFMGKKAVHELEAPDRVDLYRSIKVVEDLLNYLYELDYKASYLGKRFGRGKGATPTKL